MATDYRGHLDDPGAAAAVFYSMMLRAELVGGEESVRILDDIGKMYDANCSAYGDNDTEASAAFARALNKKGVTLGTLDRSEEAIAVYDLVEQRYGERDELALAEKVASAIESRGAALAALGSLHRLGSKDQQKYWRLAERALDAYAQRTGKPLAQVYNYACLFALRQQEAQALGALEECFKAETIAVERVRQDSDWNALRSLPEFTALLDRYSAA